jgi:hypothetical protein
MSAGPTKFRTDVAINDLLTKANPVPPAPPKDNGVRLIACSAFPESRLRRSSVASVKNEQLQAIPLFIGDFAGTLPGSSLALLP